MDSIEHGIYLDEEACEWMRQRNTTLVPTLAYFYRIATIGEGLGSPAYAVRKAKEVVGAHMKSFELAMRMGITIGMGTDFESGKLADLVAVAGNPLKEISALRRVELVMQEGRIACSRIEGVAEDLLQ